MLLDGKNAVVYGSGSIGGAVATAFGREGARVFLAGRNLATLEAVAAACAPPAPWPCRRAASTSPST